MATAARYQGSAEYREPHNRFRAIPYPVRLVAEAWRRDEETDRTAITTRDAVNPPIANAATPYRRFSVALNPRPLVAPYTKPSSGSRITKLRRRTPNAFANSSVNGAITRARRIVVGSANRRERIASTGVAAENRIRKIRLRKAPMITAKIAPQRNIPTIGPQGSRPYRSVFRIQTTKIAGARNENRTRTTASAISAPPWSAK